MTTILKRFLLHISGVIQFIAHYIKKQLEINSERNGANDDKYCTKVMPYGVVRGTLGSSVQSEDSVT